MNSIDPKLRPSAEEICSLAASHLASSNLTALKTFEDMHEQYSQTVQQFEQYYLKEKKKLAEMAKNIAGKDKEIMMRQFVYDSTINTTAEKTMVTTTFQ
jgi:phage shock protein A